ncbi:MAG TPA: acetoacetate--CoA ligase [Thermoanaerobaculia bacterium]|nr:acetoacetate--CoA ligase [Thermoanaerobaculia bacterium]
MNLENLWTPPADVLETTRVGDYVRFLARARKLSFDSYQPLWRWSVTEIEDFWDSIREYFGLLLHDPPEVVLASRAMPGARWFPGATLNYAEHALARRNEVAMVARSQSRVDMMVSGSALGDQVARAAAGLRRAGVRRGDRVVAYLPNVPETIVAFLATASLGAIFSSCAPEFGPRAVADRVRQIEPKALIACDGYRFGSREIDRAEEVSRLRADLPTLEACVILPYLRGRFEEGRFPGAIGWDELLSRHEPLAFETVPFEHPLYILYSSGTTGLPKPIVHGHGGILLEHLKMLALHHDLGEEDRFFWFTTTGWMMWNYLVSGLLVGSTVVLFDGDPAYPDLGTLWRAAEELGVTYFGTSAPYLHACMRAGLEPGRDFDLSRLRGVGSTGAPLLAEAFEWVYRSVKPRDLLLGSVSGGTDVCTAFVGACPLVPVRAGEISCRCLGAKVESFDPDGRSLVGSLGELVLTEPLPSMPVAFWNDPGSERYRASYFDRWPGVWRHGDWIEITPRGSCIITGRSDATLKRGGVRIGTSEFYGVVEALPEIAECLVVHLADDTGGPGDLLLFVVPREGVTLDEALSARIRRTLRENLSPRHVPDEIHAVASVPRTLNNKKLEVPVRRILSGEPAGKVANPGAMANPESLDYFVELAARRNR